VASAAEMKCSLSLPVLHVSWQIRVGRSTGSGNAERYYPKDTDRRPGAYYRYRFYYHRWYNHAGFSRYIHVKVLDYYKQATEDQSNR